MMKKAQPKPWMLMAASLLVFPSSCGVESDPAQGTRGAPGVRSSSGGKEPAGGKKTGGKRGPQEEVVEEIPDHPKMVLTRDDFADHNRDPFQSFLGNEVIEEDSPRGVQRQREVRMAQYNFEDLRLIGIVMSTRGIQPRALFVASDNKSKSVRQGEYFSRAEVLLAAVNRDYIEIEVVDEDLAKGLNMATGERRVIPLKKD